MTDSLSIAVHAFVSRVSMSFSVDETLLPRYVNSSTSFREVPSSVEMWPAWLKHIYSVLCALTWKPMPAAARSKLCCSVSTWFGVFTSSANCDIPNINPENVALFQIKAFFLENQNVLNSENSYIFHGLAVRHRYILLKVLYNRPLQ